MAMEKALVSECSEDWINNLSDNVICHILSFIPTKYSVRTRVLSKRWKQLFTFVPVLDFLGHVDLLHHVRYRADLTKSFQDFVNWVFKSYNVDQMDKFSCHCVGPVPLHYWISETVRRRIRELHLQTFDSYVPQTLPSCIFTCQTLTLMKLDGTFYPEVPNDACLPRLKTLELYNVYFTDGCSASKLLQSCPVLEDLSLDILFMRGNGVVYVSIPTLKYLKLLNGILYGNKLVLDVPNIQHVDCNLLDAHMISVVQGFKLLYIAHIDLGTCSDTECECLENFVHLVCHVRHLFFSVYTLKNFQTSGQSLPTFCNLTHLEIKSNYSSFDPGLVLELLDKTPHLEVLVVNNGWFRRHGDGKTNHYGQLLLENVPMCVSLHLKMVKFIGFLMWEHEWKLVEYFLKNAKFLDIVKILFKVSYANDIEMKTTLLSFPRCSGTCQIVFETST